MQLFLDANIYLEYFRENSAERLEPLKALVDLVKKKKIKLLIPEQTKQEYFRNRNSVAESTRVALKKQLNQSLYLPGVIDKDCAVAKEIDKQFEKNKKLYKELLDKFDEEIDQQKTDADLLINELFRLGKTLVETKKLVDTAYHRYMKGNPPRKSDHSYGDAITWEQLLSAANKDDLYLITKDRDYMESSKGSDRFSSFLEKEWKNKSSMKIGQYKSLAEFINFFNKEDTIKIGVVEKEKIDSLYVDLLQNCSIYDFNKKIESVYNDSVYDSFIKTYWTPDYLEPKLHNDSAEDFNLSVNNLYCEGIRKKVPTHCPYCGKDTLIKRSKTYQCANKGCQETFKI